MITHTYTQHTQHSYLNTQKEEYKNEKSCTTLFEYIPKRKISGGEPLPTKHTHAHTHTISPQQKKFSVFAYLSLPLSPFITSS
jgi:hypothetical protein